MDSSKSTITAAGAADSTAHLRLFMWPGYKIAVRRNGRHQLDLGLAGGSTPGAKTPRSRKPTKPRQQEGWRNKKNGKGRNVGERKKA